MRSTEVCVALYIALLIIGFASYAFAPWISITAVYVSSPTNEVRVVERSESGWEITYKLYLQPQLFRIGHLYVYVIGLVIAFIALSIRIWIIPFFAGILMGFSIYDFHNTIFPLLEILYQPLSYPEMKSLTTVIWWQVKDYTLLMDFGVTLATISAALFTFIAPILIAKSK